MNPFELKKETLAGRPIFRAQNDSVVFPPVISLGEAPAIPLAELVDGFMAVAFRVADHADPHVLLQAKATEAKLRQATAFWMRRAEIATAARLRDKLRSLGFAEAAEAIKNG